MSGRGSSDELRASTRAFVSTVSALNQGDATLGCCAVKLEGVNVVVLEVDSFVSLVPLPLLSKLPSLAFLLAFVDSSTPSATVLDNGDEVSCETRRILFLAGGELGGVNFFGGDDGGVNRFIVRGEAGGVSA